MKRRKNRIKLTEREESQIRRIYLNEWQNYGTVGGATVWLNTIVRFLIQRGDLEEDFIDRLKEEK